MFRLKKLALALTASSLMGLPLQSAAQNADRSANAMLKHCKVALRDGPMEMMQGVCFGYVDMVAFIGDVIPKPVQNCPPKGVTTRQLLRVVVKYIEDRPHRMHEDFRFLTVDALKDTWPCKD